MINAISIQSSWGNRGRERFESGNQNHPMFQCGPAWSAWQIRSLVEKLAVEFMRRRKTDKHRKPFTKEAKAVMETSGEFRRRQEAGVGEKHVKHSGRDLI